MYWFESSENGFLFSMQVIKLDNRGPMFTNLKYDHKCQYRDINKEDNRKART